MPAKRASFAILIAVLLGVTMTYSLRAARPAPEAHNPAEAARLNAIGVALMNQQLTEKAAAKLAEAHAADPGSATPVLNRGIALLYLQKLPEAHAELQQAAKMAPNDPRVWYNLGLTEMDEANQKAAIDDMRHVLAIDANDADAHYFVGSLDMSLGNFPDAITEFETALKLNPVHCSAQFGLARALQRSGKTQEAHEHLAVFQHLTQAKIASPLSVGYGERGRYSTMEEIALPLQPVGPMIPVRFEAKALPGPPHGGGSGLGEGACIIDIFGAGHQDLVTMDTGDHAISVYRNMGSGSFDLVSPGETGIDAKGEGIACAVGDFDNDGLPDLAVSLKHQVILFRNLGGGKFQDVTANPAAELAAGAHLRGFRSRWRS
jgi:tetratricopeptide (TPR) repeat protein